MLGVAVRWLVGLALVLAERVQQLTALASVRWQSGRLLGVELHVDDGQLEASAQARQMVQRLHLYDSINHQYNLFKIQALVLNELSMN